MKSYGQLCAVARALDVVGDRWSLLVVRELLIQGPLRFGQIQRGLPGVATNLLTQRLRDLEQQGVITRSAEPGNGPATYALTPRGQQLDGVVRELLKWGAATVPDAPADAAFQMHWLGMPARYLLRDSDPSAPETTIRFGDTTDGFDATASGGRVTIETPSPDRGVAATVTGPGPALVALVQGALDVDEARRQGVEVTGDVEALRRVLPPRSRRP